MRRVVGAVAAAGAATIALAAAMAPSKRKSCELGAAGGDGVGGRSHSCHHVVILNTGFGGEAGKVSGHHPAG